MRVDILLWGGANATVAPAAITAGEGVQMGALFAAGAIGAAHPGGAGSPQPLAAGHLPGAIAAAMARSTTPWLLVLPAGAAPASGFWPALARCAKTHPGAAGLVPRRLPFDVEQHMDPVTLEMAFVAEAPFLLSVSVFQAMGGLDARLPTPGVYFDYFYRAGQAGHALYYAPQAAVLLPGPAAADGEMLCDEPEKESLQNYIDQQTSLLLLARTHGAKGAARAARRAFLQQLRQPRPFPGVRKALLNAYLRHWWHWPHRQPTCARLPYDVLAARLAFSRGRHPLAHPLAQGPRISVIVRTHAQPDRLRHTLHSLAHQTYRNFEVVVVEDGPPTAQLVVEAFAQLDCIYHATQQHVGRSKAGNIGLALATGDYYNFLDDDDFFYPEHLEMMASAALAHPGADLLLGSAVAMMIDTESLSPYRYTVKALSLIRFDRVDIFTMCQMCQIAIMSVCFKRELYTRCGGLAENMDAHEDWAMWLRFLAVARRRDSFHIDIPRATSLFTQPADPTKAQRRLLAYRQHDDALFSDDSIRFNVSLADMRRFYDGVLADMRHLQAAGQLEEFLARQQEERHIP